MRWDDDWQNESLLKSLGESIKHCINEFERANLLERQREGIQSAKENGKYKGGQVKRIDEKTFTAAYERYKSRELNKTQLAAELKISRPTLDKLLKDKGLK